MSMIGLGIDAVERGWVPDALTRAAIRSLCRQRLRETCKSRTNVRNAAAPLVERMRSGPIALVPEKANEQHYEVPPEFFAAVLGPRRKYSCCFYPEAKTSLAAAEEYALAISCERAGLANGQSILELGCGWGSLTLWMAEHYPDSRITAVSNSAPQRGYIEAEAARRGFNNVRVLTADMNDFSAPAGSFDRVVSVEMFEHMRNYQQLLERISSWLVPGGKLFIHIFCHRSEAYAFETEGDANWMGRYFFTGGIMPSADLLREFQHHLQLTNQWSWNGTHYQRTSEAWLHNLDRNRREIMPILTSVYGEAEASRWFHRWRMFFLAVAELFGYANGEEWFVSHYLMEKPA